METARPGASSKLAEKAAVTAGAQPVLLIDRLQRAAEFPVDRGKEAGILKGVVRRSPIRLKRRWPNM